MARPHLFRWTLTLLAVASLLPPAAWLLDPLAVLEPPPHDPARVLHLVYTLTDPLIEIGGISFEWLRVATYAVVEATSLFGLAVVLALTWRGQLTPAKRHLAVAFVAFMVFAALALFAGRGIPQLGGAVATPAGGALVGALAAACYGIGTGSLLRFAATFPRPLSPGDVHAVFELKRAALPPWRRRWQSTGFDEAAVSFAVRSLQWRWLPHAGALGLLLLYAVSEPMFLYYGWASMLAVAAPYLLARAGQRVAGEPERRQLLWINAGFVAGVWTMVLLGTLPFAFALIFAEAGAAAYIVVLMVILPPAAALVIAAGLAFAVLYQGAVDPATVIDRTTLYGMTGVVLVFLFAGVENVVADVLADRLGFPPSLGGWIAGGTIALAFGPLRDWLERRLRRPRPAATSGTSAAVERIPS